MHFFLFLPVSILILARLRGWPIFSPACEAEAASGSGGCGITSWSACDLRLRLCPRSEAACFRGCIRRLNTPQLVWQGWPILHTFPKSVERCCTVSKDGKGHIFTMFWEGGGFWTETYSILHLHPCSTISLSEFALGLHPHQMWIWNLCGRKSGCGYDVTWSRTIIWDTDNQCGWNSLYCQMSHLARLVPPGTSSPYCISLQYLSGQSPKALSSFLVSNQQTDIGDRECTHYKVHICRSKVSRLFAEKCSKVT